MAQREPRKLPSQSGVSNQGLQDPNLWPQPHRLREIVVNLLVGPGDLPARIPWEKMAALGGELVPH